MKIKPSKPITFEELEKLKEQKQAIVNEKKRTENKALLGSLKKPTKTKDRFYLPVLHLNDATQWESQPLANRIRFTDEVAYKTCLGNCCGVEGLKAGCCQMDPEDLEHVLGPVTEEWITDTINWLKRKKIMVSRADIVIDFEEGRVIGERFFTGHRKIVFQSIESYPIIRFQINGPRFSCKFLGPVSGKCTIYEQRPAMCREYLCQYVKSHFLIRTSPKAHPNTYKKDR